MTNVILVFKTTCITTDTVNDTLLNLSPGLKKVKNFNPPHITYTHHNAYDFFFTNWHSCKDIFSGDIQLESFNSHTKDLDN